MKKEMLAVKQNNTSNLDFFPPEKKAVGCQWVYNVKLNSDRLLTRLKAYSVAKGYSQVYEMDYQDTFSSIV